MKKLLLVLLPLAVVYGCGKVELTENKGNDNPYIPDEPNIDPEDDIFLQFCIERFDTNGDGVISQYEADQVKTISCVDMKITKLTDIDKFSNLETIDCSYNSLTSLDLSKNRHLTDVNCSRNSLRSLSVTGCKELQILKCSYNSLSSLDLSSVMALESVDCSNNSLATLNVGGCSALRTLDCSYNKLTTLDLSKTTGIVTVNCKRNSLTSLILTDCTALASLDCSYNSLTSLDVSDCLKLSTLDCTDNTSLKELILYDCYQTIANLNKDGNTEIKHLVHYYSIGEKYLQNGKEGIVFYITDNGLHGKIVSEDENRYVWPTKFVNIFGTDIDDGMANMKEIQAISGWHEKYPTFAWCADKGNGWYLPAVNELKTLYESKAVELKSDYYCSSTGEYYPDDWGYGEAIIVYFVDMDNGNTIWYGGRTEYDHYGDYYGVRAVSAF